MATEQPSPRAGVMRNAERAGGSDGAMSFPRAHIPTRIQTLHGAVTSNISRALDADAYIIAHRFVAWLARAERR